MSVCGPKPFDNQIAQDYILTLVNSNIHNIILEPIDRNTDFIKHKLAYYYDRFRAAVELMILFETNNVYKFSKGYYDLAIEKLTRIKKDYWWINTWDNFSGLKSYNYNLDIDNQLSKLQTLQKLAKD